MSSKLLSLLTEYVLIVIGRFRCLDYYAENEHKWESVFLDIKERDPNSVFSLSPKVLPGFNQLLKKMFPVHRDRCVMSTLSTPCIERFPYFYKEMAELLRELLMNPSWLSDPTLKLNARRLKRAIDTINQFQHGLINYWPACQEF
jgi:hypothetical protein